MIDHTVRVSRARFRMIADSPWFGHLAMRLIIEPTDQIPTFSTDGTYLLYNPSFLATLTDAELIGVIAHEVMHCAMLHPFRLGKRDPEEYNISADYLVNRDILKAGFTLPKDVLVDSQYDADHWTVESVYAHRQANKPPSKGGQGKQGKGTGNLSTGSVTKPNPNASNESASSGQGKQPSNGPQPSQPSQTPTSGHMTAEDWQIAAEQATMIARKAGKLPGNADRAIKATYATQQDWKQILREFIAATHPSDYSWTRPNRRYIADGLYLPGVVKENTGELVIAIDTSGSIGGPMLDSFASELCAIVEDAKPERIHVVYCDSRVQHAQSFGPDEELRLSARGGGGTAFNPVFQWVESARGAGDIGDMKALIYLTDLECSDCPQQPDYPVLWVAPLWASQVPAFGELIRIDTHDRS